MDRFIYIINNTKLSDHSAAFVSGLIKRQTRLCRGIAVLSFAAGLLIAMQNKTNKELRLKVDELQKELDHVQSKDE